MICWLAGGLATGLTGNSAPVTVAVPVGLYLMFAIKVADQWDKVPVLRLGRFRGLRGPGVFHIIPVVDTLGKFVDQRVRVTDVTAESALTRDTVPVNVDAIVFWLVWMRQQIGFLTFSYQTVASNYRGVNSLQKAAAMIRKLNLASTGSIRAKRTRRPADAEI